MASNTFNSRQMVIVIFFKKEIVLKIFSSGEYKNAGFSKLETQFWRFETLFVWVSSILLVLACPAVLLSIVWRVKGRLTLLIYSAISQVILTQMKFVKFQPKRGVGLQPRVFDNKSFSVYWSSTK